MTTFQDIVNYVAKGQFSSNIWDMVEETESYQKHLNTLYSKCKPLEGTPKQIKWATDIRNEKLTNAAHQIVMHNAEKKADDQGLLNFSDTKEGYNKRLKAIIKNAYKYIVADASAIITNR